MGRGTGYFENSDSEVSSGVRIAASLKCVLFSISETVGTWKTSPFLLVADFTCSLNRSHFSVLRLWCFPISIGLLHWTRTSTDSELSSTSGIP